MPPQPWTLQNRLLHLQTKWLTLIGEHLQDPNGTLHEYWRIEKADSLIVLPLQNQQILLPPPVYRPGLGTATLDLPGGRCPAEQDRESVAIAILQRELGLPAPAIDHLTPLNTEGWPINSSFSNQKLYGYIAQIRPDAIVLPEYLEAAYPANESGVRSLLARIQCLQCRLVLREWQAI